MSDLSLGPLPTSVAIDPIGDTPTISLASLGSPSFSGQRLVSRTEAAGPLGVLDGNPFSTNSVTYPLDLNNLAHAIIFNINVQTTTPATDSGIQSRSQMLRANNILGTSGSFNVSNPLSSSDSGQPVSSSSVNFTLNRKTTRIAQTIGLYIPETMVYDSYQNYDTPDLMEKLTPGGMALIYGFAHKDKSVELGAAGMLAASLIGGKAASIVGAATASDGIVQSAIKAGLGYAINPQIEVLYNSPKLRTFTFEFLFAPRSAEEADAVWEIIQLFRYHAAPEFTGALTGINGAFFIPPSEFDITFLRNTGNGFIQNTNIPTIDTCVITQIRVDYAPEGQWVTHTDGFPVVTKLYFEMQELDILVKNRILAGF